MNSVVFQILEKQTSCYKGLYKFDKGNLRLRIYVQFTFYDKKKPCVFCNQNSLYVIIVLGAKHRLIKLV